MSDLPPQLRARTPAAFMLCTFAIVILIAVACFLPRSPLSLDDGLRHFVLAERVVENGIGSEVWSDFLFRGYFTEHKLDPWFGADLAYVPFTFIPNRILGIKTAGFCFGMIFLLSFIPLIQFYKPRPFLGCLTLLILILGSDLFPFRLLIARPYTLMTAIFFFALYSIIRSRYYFLAPLLFVAVLFSHLFVFPLLLTLIASGVLILYKKRKEALMCALASLSGAGIGLLLHPWRSEYLLWIRDIFFVIPFSKNLDLGAEVYSGFGFSDMGPLFLLLLVVLIIIRLALIGALPLIIRKRPDIILVFILTIGFFVAFAQWVRALDFFWPTALLLCLQLCTVSKDAEKDLLGQLRQPVIGRKINGLHIIIAILAVTSIVIVSHIAQSRDGRDPALAHPVTMIPDGSRVFNPDWDFFPLYFFNNDSVQYARGVDPTLDDAVTRDLMEEITSESFFDLRSLRFIPQEKKVSDINSWVSVARDQLESDYIIIHKIEWESLVDQLTNEAQLPVFTENHALIIFALR